MNGSPSGSGRTIGASTRAARRARAVMGVDLALVATLLFAGWAHEWTWNRPQDSVSQVLLYARLALCPVFFSYYWSGRRQWNDRTTHRPSLGGLPWLLFALVCVALTERVLVGFVGTWVLWKEYYYLALLPFWGLVGYDLAGDRKRVGTLFRRLAALGAILSFASFGMASAGVSPDSWLGPMYWPYRFAAIFSFFYYLTVIATGARRTPGTALLFAGSLLPVCWDLYKFTIVSAALGMIGWAAFLWIKAGSFRARSVTSVLGVATLLALILVGANRIYGGAVYSSMSAIYEDRWLHNAELLTSGDPMDRFDIVSGRRSWMWQEMVPRIERHLLLGAGLGQRYEDEIVTHNGYLDLLLSFGTLGVLVFLSALAIWLRKLAQCPRTSGVLVHNLICVGYISTILAANLFGSVWIQFYTISFYVALLGGISFRLCSGRSEGGTR